MEERTEGHGDITDSSEDMYNITISIFSYFIGSIGWRGK